MSKHNRTHEEIQRDRARSRDYYQRNKADHMAKNRLYREQHRESLKQWDREYRAGRKEHTAAMKRAWLERNRERVKAREAINRAKNREATNARARAKTAAGRTERLAARAAAIATKEAAMTDADRAAVDEQRRTQRLVSGEKYREANREKCREAQRRWREAHPELKRQRAREFAKKKHHQRFAERKAAATPVPLREVTDVSIQTLKRLLGSDAKALAEFTSCLGPRQRHILAYLYERRDEILHNGTPAEIEELNRLGVPLKIEGSLKVKTTYTNSLRSSEERGLVLRQSVWGNPLTCQPRTSASDPHRQRTSHVVLLEPGIIVGERLSARSITRQRLTRWQALSQLDRIELVHEMIRWRLEFVYYANVDVGDLLTCLKTGQNPVDRCPWAKAFGEDELNWQHIPTQFLHIGKIRKRTPHTGNKFGNARNDKETVRSIRNPFAHLMRA